jgi:hypothetical protein
MKNEYDLIWKEGSWFEKGHWKLVPKGNDSGSIILAFFIAFMFMIIIGSILIMTIPVWACVVGFQMTREKRYIAGVIVILGLLYFHLDMSNHWISSLLFHGWTNDEGEFTKGIFGFNSSYLFLKVNYAATTLGLGYILDGILIGKYGTKYHDGKVTKHQILAYFLPVLLTLPFYLLTSFSTVNSHSNMDTFLDKSVEHKSRTAFVIDISDANNKPQEVSEDQHSNISELNIDNYIKHNAQYVKDLSTNSYWYIAPDSSFNFDEAIQFASNIKESNLVWRLPTYDEIKRLYNSEWTAGEGFFMNNTYYPAKIHYVFNEIGSGSWFWVTDLNTNEVKAHAINLHHGIKVAFDKVNPKYPVHILLISE